MSAIELERKNQIDEGEGTPVPNPDGIGEEAYQEELLRGIFERQPDERGEFLIKECLRLWKENSEMRRNMETIKVWTLGIKNSMRFMNEITPHDDKENSELSSHN